MCLPFTCGEVIKEIFVSMRYLFVLCFLMLCLCSCTNQADIQKAYNSGAFISIVSYDIKQHESALTGNVEKHSNIGFALVYDKENEKMDLCNTYRLAKTFANIRYNKMSSDDTQTCLQSDDVRFIIMNSGESYLVKMYEWYNRDWTLALTLRNCEVKASDKFEMPSLDYTSALKEADIKESSDERDDTAESSEEMAVDTYEVVEADSYDGFVSIRAEKSSKSRELGRLPNGEFADFLEYDGEWYKINYEGIIGYVYGKFAKKNTMIDP